MKNCRLQYPVHGSQNRHNRVKTNCLYFTDRSETIPVHFHTKKPIPYLYSRRSSMSLVTVCTNLQPMSRRAMCCSHWLRRMSLNLSLYMPSPRPPSITMWSSWLIISCSNSYNAGFPIFTSVAYPDPSHTYLFGLPGSGSVSQRYGSGSFYQAKIVRKQNLDSYCFVTSC